LRSAHRATQQSPARARLHARETLLHVAQDDLPFGGVGASGMGAYQGIHGFAQFSKMKPVFRQARLNGLGLFRAPYGKRFEAMMKLLLR
jgi:acyl-CoA reductase-like NAD-dependent aldehyde dehydrogenase